VRGVLFLVFVVGGVLGMQSLCHGQSGKPSAWVIMKNLPVHTKNQKKGVTIPHNATRPV
jgi:hypothetical protein